ncbi:hypothetical protein B0A50_05051 [Salinomyces thailandicus]|uniref:Tyrosine specific protein phosphatases domain-containing protein n=1 Tax=Salinomyces thailandicus TaxID=706561 RepID=A0A4U0TW49_9PEZI|nr:hypothetical protein B0A50_05051 [Salinomyces thailandica]
MAETNAFEANNVANTPDADQQPFDKILNFRDVGIFINRALGHQHIRPCKLYRSARPDSATQQDRTRLVSSHRIKTIIDLRTETEHIDSRRKHVDKISANPLTAPADPQAPLRIPEINYVDIDFNGSGYTRALISQLTWYQTAQLCTFYALGYRKEAISILSENVMEKQGLVGMAISSLRHCRPEVKAGFDVLADAEAYPVMIHCTQGKDRTGLTVLLTLMLLGVSEEAIEMDYKLSERELEPEKEEKLAEIQSIGLPASFAECPGDWVQSVCKSINDDHGGIGEYLLSCGVSEEQQMRVRRLLCTKGGWST